MQYGSPLLAKEYYFSIVNGGVMFIIRGSSDLRRRGKQYFVSIKVPLVFTSFIKSNFFVVIVKVFPKSIEEALLIKISIFPNL